MRLSLPIHFLSTRNSSQNDPTSSLTESGDSMTQQAPSTPDQNHKAKNSSLAPLLCQLLIDDSVKSPSRDHQLVFQKAIQGLIRASPTKYKLRIFESLDDRCPHPSAKSFMLELLRQQFSTSLLGSPSSSPSFALNTKGLFGDPRKILDLAIITVPNWETDLDVTRLKGSVLDLLTDLAATFHFVITLAAKQGISLIDSKIIQVRDRFLDPCRKFSLEAQQLCLTLSPDPNDPSSTQATEPLLISLQMLDFHLGLLSSSLPPP